MQSPNKINSKEQQIATRQEIFHDFLKSIKQSKPEYHLDLQKHQLQDAESKQSESSSHYNQSEVLNAHKELDNYEVHSFSQHVMATPNVDKRKGDDAIRNKIRYSVGTRHKVGGLQLPSYCFNQMKQKLDEYFKLNKKSSNQHHQEDIPLQPNNKPHLRKQHNISSLRQKKLILGNQKLKKLSQMNENIMIRYCQYNKLTKKSNIKEITNFFYKLLELSNYNISNAKIQKYTDCIYFGDMTKKNYIHQGFIYYYNGDVYYGELYNFQKHGHGVEIHTDGGKIYKGEFKQGQMVGYFEVKSNNNEVYYGQLKNSRYHGHGKLIDEKGTFQGQFRNGNQIYDKNPKKQGYYEVNKNAYMMQNQKRRQQSNIESNFYPRSSSSNFQQKHNFQANSSRQLYTRNKSFNNQPNQENIYYRLPNNQPPNSQIFRDTKRYKGRIVTKNIRNTLRDFSFDFSGREVNDNPEYHDEFTVKSMIRMPKISQQMKRTRNFNKQKIQEQQLEDQTSQQQEPLKIKL